MRAKENRGNEKKRMGMLAVLLTVMVSLVLGIYSTDIRAAGAPEMIPFKDAEFFIEYNATDGDTGVQVFLDDDDWRRISISDPHHRRLFSVGGHSTLGRQGLTELFFESVEPELADLPVVKFLKRFPEGEYKFRGVRNDWVILQSEVEFTHVMPCNAEVLPEEGAILDPESEVIISWEEVDMVVDPVATDEMGETVCTDPGSLDQELEIDLYQVIIENEDIDLIINMTSDDRNLTVPPQLLEDNTLYIFEVLAKEESGNQTITESYFCTGPDLDQEDCEELFEAH